MKRSENKKKSKKLWLKIPLAITLVVGIGIGSYAFSIYNNAKQTVNKKYYKPVASIDHKPTKKKVKAVKPLNIL